MVKHTIKRLGTVAAFLFALINAFNPLAYVGITQKTLVQTANRFFCLLLIVTLATAALMLPSLPNSNELGKLSKLSIKLDIATNGPIDMILPVGNAKVLVNTTADSKTASRYDVVLTGKELRTKPFLCFLREEVCNLLGIRQHATQIKEVELSQDSGRTLTSIFLLMLPGLLLLSYALMVVKYAAIVLAASAICYIILKTSRKDTGMLDTLKISAYAATVLVVLDFASLMLRNSQISIHPAIPLAAYLAMLITALVINEHTNTDAM